MRGQPLTATLLISIALVMVAVGFGAPRSTEAVVEPVYTLPFYSNYRISCGFGCYSGHAGVDIELGRYGEPGEVIAAAKEGTAKNCGFDLDAGNYVVLDHGNGHRTRYLHLNSISPVTNGQSIARGEIIGFEGNTGDSTDDHLHFETRHGATSFTCGKDGTAVDPYGSSTYMWQDNPPNHADFGPAIASWSSSTVNEFVRGKNDDLYQRVNGGSWTKPRSGCLRSGPGAATLNSTNINVFIRGCDDKLYQLRYTGSWGYWAAVPGGTCLRGAPAAASWGSNRVDVFYRGCNDRLYHGWSVNGGVSWTAEGVPGTCLRSAPSAVSWGSGRLDVVYRGCDDAIWHNWQPGGSAWYGESLGGCTMLAPAIASQAANKLDVFHRGCGPAITGEGIYRKSQTDGSSWSGWSSLGGCLASAPGADAWAPDWLDALYRGCDSPANAWRAYRSGGSWPHVNTGAWP